MKKTSLKQYYSHSINKIIALVLLITFTTTQVSYGQDPLTSSLTSNASRPQTQNWSEVIQQASIQPIQDIPSEFVLDGSPLSSPVVELVFEEEVVAEEQSKRNEGYEYTRYEFKEAFEQLQSNVANAFIIRNLNEENLKQLLTLPMEVGIAVVSNEIILFTSGNENDIRVTLPAQNLLKQATFMAHTHPQDNHVEGPSELDLEQAGDLEEYVLTNRTAYAYGNQSDEIKESTYTKVLAAMHLAMSQGRRTLSGNVQARSVLNQFIREMDLLNEKGADSIVFRASASQQTLSDGTVLHFEGDALVKEVLPNGDEVHYGTNGAVAQYVYTSGNQVEYLNDAAKVIVLKGADGVVQETISQPTPTPLNEAEALRVTLQHGLEAFYVEGALVEFQTATGIRITDFELDENNKIVNALLTYSNGTLDVIRDGALLRRIHPDGTIVDILPSGPRVREISEMVQFYAYEKTSQTAITSTRIFDANNNEVFYDELGLLVEAHDTEKSFYYTRSENLNEEGEIQTYSLQLNLTTSSTPSDQTLREATYSPEGRILQMKLNDSTVIQFNDLGGVSRVLNASGEEITYEYLQEGESFDALQVVRGNEQFNYESNGFLSEIVTTDGTIRRIANDENGDGIISGDETVDLLLESLTGDTLQDFELDADGNILNGLITTKEGIKQTIANGVLTQFETVEGKVYSYNNNEATLTEWKQADGKRIIYEAGGIKEILFPNGNRMHTLGFSADLEVENYVEELDDGTQKYYERVGQEAGFHLTKLITSNQTEIYYDKAGLAERIQLPEGEQQKVIYSRDATGAVQDITFQSAYDSRTFQPNGTILKMLHKGAQAEVSNNEISKLFTRFGEVKAPTFNESGILEGVIDFVDGTQLFVEEGSLVQAIRPSGTKINYVDGVVSSMETENNRYSLIYDDTSGSMEGIQIRFDSLENQPQLPLIPFLEKPDEMLESLQGSDAPEYPIIFNGDAVIQSSNKKYGEGALQLDGFGDTLEIQNSSDEFDFGTGDFTIDAWMNIDEDRIGNTTVASKYSNGVGWVFSVDAHDQVMRLHHSGWDPVKIPISINKGEWNHVALVKEGNTVRFFINGVQQGGDYTSNNAYNGADVPLKIGAYETTAPMMGELDDVRISKGIARWTSNFTPPVDTPSVDSNTKLLLSFEPPSEDSPELAAEVAELSQILLSNPLHNTIAQGDVKSIFDLGSDSGGEMKTFTTVGETHVDTNEKKFGESSIHMDGSFDFIDVEPHEDMDFGSEDFTIDAWINIDPSKIGNTTVASKYTGGTGWVFSADSWDGRMRLHSSGSSSAVVNANIPKGEWVHVAVVREGNVIRFYMNGEQQGTDRSAAATYNGGNTVTRIGGYEHDAQMKGHMDEVRISKGVARWTENFIPSTEEYTRDANTSLLLHMSQGEFNDGAEQNTAAPGEKEYAEVQFGKRVLDPERQETLEFGSKFLPEWLNVSLENYRNQGFVTRGVTQHIHDNLPSITAQLIDMNGDGLQDRVYMDLEDYADFWWVQLNTAGGFSEPMKWEGVDRYWDPSNENYFALNYGTLRFHEGRAPVVKGMLQDLNGDGLPDRVLQSIHDTKEWYVQWNNGKGFDETVMWTDKAHALSAYIPMHSKYAIRVRGDQSEENVQEVVSELIDLDGDGLPDRIVRPWAGEHDHWFFQKNLGKDAGFADALIWEGVDSSFHADPEVGKSISWYNADWSSHDFVTDLGGLYDLNGDGLLDRVLTRSSGGANDALDWYVQFNTGKGFEDAVLWDDSLRALPGAPNERLGTGLRSFKQFNDPRRVLYDLVDVTGDGLPDRVSMVSYHESTQSSWFVEVNEYDGLGKFGFAEAVEWKGIDGDSALETSISQDDENFRMQPSNGVAGPHDRAPSYIKKSVDLRDMNGDRIPDRVIFRESEQRWLVQFGTGKGYLPAEELLIAGLNTSSSQLRSSLYDYVHVSLKAGAAITPELGKVVVKLVVDDASLTEEEREAASQSWEVENLTTDWQDFYLPMDTTKPDAANLRIEFIAADENNHPEIPIYLDNMTFTRMRAPAAKDWLDRLLSEEAVLAEIHDAETETLAQYLGFSNAEEPTNFDWSEALQAETKILFDAESNALTQFETAYGTVSEYENGVITKTTLTDGTEIRFEVPEEAEGNQMSYTVENTDGTTESVKLAYGRVRSATSTSQDGSDAGNVDYRYEFDELGREITVVTDASSGIVERYRDAIVNGTTVSQLISRTAANGLVTSFLYDSKGEVRESQISYKGRVQNTFLHGQTPEGVTTLTTSDGVVEEYDDEGNILFHTTPEGFRYKHEFVNAPVPTTTITQEIITFADGSTLTLDVPVVSLEECVEGCEQIHRMVLTHFTADNGEYAAYSEEVAGALGDSELSGLLLEDGIRISFSRIVRSESFDAETGDSQISTQLLDATLFHSDGTVTVFENGFPKLVTTATGREINITSYEPHAEDPTRFMVNGSESAAFLHSEAQKLWDELVNQKWLDYRLSNSVPVQMEYTLEDQPLTRKFAEGTVELYSEAGQLEQVLSPSGERLMLYSYDEEGNIVDIDMEGARRNLTAAELRLRADIALDREEALATLAEREQVINETIEGEYRSNRQYLLELRSRLESKREEVASLQVKGSAGHAVVGSAMVQIQLGMNQINNALETLALQRVDALKDLAVQVAELNTQIEDETAAAYGEIEEEVTAARASVLSQELTPVIYHWYRLILGRDPSKQEYDEWIATADYELGLLDLDLLKTTLEESQERAQRQMEVDAIRASVAEELNAYVALAEEDKIAFAASLGIPVTALIDLTAQDASGVLDYLNGQSLHFGQSAFISLEALLADAGHSFDRVDLATQLILIDVLTGTLHAHETEDLILSLYAMRLVAANHGLETQALGLSYEALKAMYKEECGGTTGSDPVSSTDEGQTPECNFRLVAHIDGNHFVIINGIEERVRVDAEGNAVLDEMGNQIIDDFIHFTDPGAGAEGAHDEIELSQEEFLNTWLDSSDPESRFGYVLSPRAPPVNEEISWETLSTEKQMEVRGAFFGFFKKIFKGVVKFIVNSIKAVVDFIVEVVKGLVQAIVTFVKGFGNLFKGLFTGDFSLALKGLYQIFIQPAGDIINGVMMGIVKGYENHISTYQAFGASERTARRIVQTQIGTAKIAIGIAAVAGGVVTANPQLTGIGLGFISSGTGDILRTHTDLSESTIGAIEIGAAALGAIAAGGFDPTITAGEALKASLPHLAQDLASAGLVAVGNEIGLDPRLTAVINVPLRAAVGSAVGGFVDKFTQPDGTVVGYRDDGSKIYVETPQDFNNFLSGAIDAAPTSIGTNISLGDAAQTVEAPSIGNFIPNLIDEMTGGSGTSTGVDWSLGNTVMQQISSNVGRLAYGVVDKIGETISFASKVVEGIGSATVEGVKKAVRSFSKIFSRETQDNIYNDEIGLRDAEVSFDGENWTWKTNDAEINYDATTGSISESFGVGGAAQISGLGQDSSGNLYYEKLTYSTAFKDSTLTQEFENGNLSSWEQSFTDGVRIRATGDATVGSFDENGALTSGTFEVFQDPIDIPAPEPDPEPTLKQPSFLNRIVFDVVLGKVAEVAIDSAQATSPSTESDSRLDKNLFVLVNGIGNDELLNVPDYLLNLEEDIASKSEGRIFDEDIIPIAAFQKTPLANFLGNAMAISHFGSVYKVLTKAWKGLAEVAGKELTRTPVDSVIDIASRTYDVYRWVAEVADPVAHARVVSEIKGGLDIGFDWAIDGDKHRIRDMVAVGYSGSFIPLAEVLKNNPYSQETKRGYNAKVLVGLGAVTVNLEEVTQELMLKLHQVKEMVLNPSKVNEEMIEAGFETLDSLSHQLNPALEFGQTIRNTILGFIQAGNTDAAVKAYEEATEGYEPFFKGYSMGALTGSAVEMVVNVYGSEDIVTEFTVGETKLGGYREELGDYKVNDDIKSLFNVKIMGASHSDYIRREKGLLDKFLTEADYDWNVKVSEFVAEMTGFATDRITLQQYLTEKKGEGIAELIDNEWVITLEGFKEEVSK